MKIIQWLDPDTSEFEYRFELYTWWDNLAQDERSAALIKAMVSGTKLVWILQAVAKCIESGDLEKRIELLEGLNK